MGQPIVVTEKPSSIPGVIRFETNRALTGMGHERYLPGTEVWGERPPDELARRLFTQASVAGVQINGNIVTVDLAKGHGPDGLKAIIENLYRFYPDGPAAAASEAAVPPADANPADANPADPSPAAEPEAAAEPEPEPEPEPVTEPEAAAESEPEAAVESEPEAEPAAE